jgi:hypothetical protein
MPLTTTPGSATSDSYATLAQAMAYHTAKGNAAWAASTDAMRETALRRATEWVDATYRTRWQNIGLPVYPRVQALEWPLSGITDPYGYDVNHLTIPTEIINATSEAALRELAAPGSLSPDYLASESVKTATAGPVSVTYMDNAGAGAAMPILTIVDGILARLLGGRARNVAELVRA